MMSIDVKASNNKALVAKLILLSQCFNWRRLLWAFIHSIIKVIKCSLKTCHFKKRRHPLHWRNGIWVGTSWSFALCMEFPFGFATLFLKISKNSILRITTLASSSSPHSITRIISSWHGNRVVDYKEILRMEEWASFTWPRQKVA